jgi:hypothetical protein
MECKTRGRRANTLCSPGRFDWYVRVQRVPRHPIRATGLQEALIWQVRDVAELLGSDYAWVSASSRPSNPSIDNTLPGRRR